MAGQGTDDITVAILVASDSFFAGKEHDTKGELLKQLVESRKHINGSVIAMETLPDDQEQIKAKLVLWSDYLKVNLILTTGGTGFALRDVTPEATKAVVDKEAPGMALAMLQGSLKITPMAMLSRPVCGIRGKTLIINLPGSPKGAAECFLLVSAVIPHAVDLLREHKRRVQKMHTSLLAEGVKYPQKQSNQSQMKVQLSQSIQGSVLEPERKTADLMDKSKLGQRSLLTWNKCKTSNESGTGLGQLVDPCTIKDTDLNGSYVNSRASNFHKAKALRVCILSNNSNPFAESSQSCTKRHQPKSSEAISSDSTNMEDFVSESNQCSLIGKYESQIPLNHALTFPKPFSPSKETEVSSEEDKERSAPVTEQVVRDISMESLTIKRTGFCNAFKAHSCQTQSIFKTESIHTKSDQDVALQCSDSLQLSHPLTIATENGIKHSKQKALALQVHQKSIKKSSSSIASGHQGTETLSSCQTQAEKNVPTVVKTKSNLLKAAKIYNRKQEDDIAYPGVGADLRRFLSQHPLIQGIQLYKGKRQVKRNLVKLCRYEKSPEPSGTKSSSTVQRQSKLIPIKYTDTTLQSKQTLQAAEVAHESVPSIPSIGGCASGLTVQSTTEHSPLAYKTSPDKWHRGKDLLERNSLEDYFILTDEGKLALDEVKAGRARDQYVVNWYMWCPGRTNCRRKCGGYGNCCQGMQHKQDRHNCCLMVNLKLFLSDLQHWRVHVTGSHVPDDANVQWVPPARTSTPNSSAIPTKHSNKADSCVSNSMPEKFPSYVTFMSDLEKQSSEEAYIDVEFNGSVVDLGSSGNHRYKTLLSPRSASRHEKLVSCGEMVQIPSLEPMVFTNSKSNQTQDNMLRISPRQDKKETPNQNTNGAVPFSSSFNLDMCGKQTQSHKNISCNFSAATMNTGTDEKTHDEQNRKVENRADLEIHSEQSLLTPSVTSNLEIHSDQSLLTPSVTSNLEIHSEQSLLTPSVTSSLDSDTTHKSHEAPLANVIPSKKRISKMLSKLKHHRMRRLSLLKKRAPRVASISGRRDTILGASDSGLGTLSFDLNKLDSQFVILPLPSDSPNFSTKRMKMFTDETCENKLSIFFSNKTAKVLCDSTPETGAQAQVDPSLQVSHDLYMNLQESEEPERNSMKTHNTGQPSGSASRTVGSSNTIPTSSAATNFIYNGNCTTVFSLANSLSAVTTNAGHIFDTAPYNNNYSNPMYTLAATDSRNCQGSFGNSSLPQLTQELHFEGPALDLPFYPSNMYENQYRACQVKENPKSFTEDLDIESQSQSLLPTKVNLHQQRLEFSGPPSTTCSSGFNTLSAPLHQASYEPNSGWSGTNLHGNEPLLYPCSQTEEEFQLPNAESLRYGSGQDNREPDQYSEALPTYQEAAQFLATQFGFLNS
ncbi:gephyrin [Elysia marginata]|uniref:molybdopterin molybdotransferase n=1 Tax=Elysia marginata TaxID=1093978 RepID=A0AAV4INQ3_9GAST|nr:gephyrin [Elysia marginata]